MKTAILLVNTGSPEAATPQAVRAYLAEFLSDHAVVDLPGWIWQPVLKGIILRRRPSRSAQKYQAIWRDDGSPLVSDTLQLASKLQAVLNQRYDDSFLVRAAMRYGKPDLLETINTFRGKDIQQLIVLPLFPQYSTTTTASIIQLVNNMMIHPKIKIISNYYQIPAYQEALSSRVQTFWREHGKAEKILFSFHGIPLKRVKTGDPYAQQCEQTAYKLATDLNLPAEMWAMAYQSRFGGGRWLKPDTQKLLQKWARYGVRDVQVFAPGFAIDCLETLHELAVEMAESFQKAGGERLTYIPALNTSDEHVEVLLDTLERAAVL